MKLSINEHPSSAGQAQSGVSAVRELYEEFTFPLKGNHKDFVARYVQPHVRGLPKTILDAGCGTGNSGRDIIRSFPESRMTGIDFSENSLEQARKFAVDEGLKNVTYRFHDLMQPFASDEVKYEFLVSLGVVHHTPDPKRALRNLRSVAADGAQFILAIYGKYGRIETEMRRELVGLVRQQTGTSNRDLVPLVTKLLAEPVVMEHSFCKAGAPRSFTAIMSNPQRLIRSARRRLLRLARRGGQTSGIPVAIGIADQYLHPMVHSWTATEWVEAAESAGFVLDDFIYDPAPNGMCIPINAPSLVRDVELRNFLEALKPRERYAVLELIFRPTMHFMSFATSSNVPTGR